MHIKRKREIYVLKPKNKQKYKNNSTIRFRKSTRTNGGCKCQSKYVKKIQNKNVHFIHLPFGKNL